MAKKPDVKIVREKEIAMDFAAKVHQKFDKMVKASVLFGSQAKNTAEVKSDIDVILIIDDASISWDLELISWYREELGKIISASKYERNLHVNTIKLTTWWLDLLHGDPLVLNIIRYGEALIDSGGFFNPLKALLSQGKMSSTPEAIFSALQRAPFHLARSRAAEMGAIEGVYWAMVDSAQAALISAGKMPPSPEHIPELLQEAFVDRGMLKAGYVRAMRDIYALHKNIAYGKTSDLKGAEIDSWQNTADSFLAEMTRIINELIEVKK
jgi:uncharacterized protein (UPF0332 family)/predicted nucleotidyltransferase